MFKNTPVATPRSLTVLYDPRCGFCVAARHWIEAQETYLPVRFVRASSAEALRLYPELSRPENAEELFVVADDGAVFEGGSAWLLCLWALVDYREWSYRLSTPALLPLARRAFQIFSKRRKSISKRLGLLPEPELVERLRAVPDPACQIPKHVPDERRHS